MVRFNRDLGRREGCRLSQIERCVMSFECGLVQKTNYDACFFWWIQFHAAEAFIWIDMNKERSLADSLHPGVLVS